MRCSGDADCAIGWRCDASSSECRPRSTLVCYVPTPRRHSVQALSDTETNSTVDPTETAASGSASGSHTAPIDAISAIASLMRLADQHNQTVAPSSTDAPALLSPSPSPSPSPTVQRPSNKSSSSSNDVRDSVLLSLTEPKNGAVYAVSTSLPVAWTVTLLDGDRSVLLEQLAWFRVDFSRDGGRSFASVARSVRPNRMDASTLSFRFNWTASLACDACVLRVCSDGPRDRARDVVCLRSDGAADDSDAPRSGDATSAAAPKITFHIVREVLSCACGVAASSSSFVLVSYVLALVVPLATLALEQCVTFYQDRKLFGMMARRGGPGGAMGSSPLLGFYADEATRRGRALLFALLLGLCVGNGVVVAQINRERFPGQRSEIAVLWLVTFVLVAVIGFVYCSVVHGAIFAWRWRRETPPPALEEQSGPVAELTRDLARPASPDARQQQQQQQQQQRRTQPTALVAPPVRSTEWL
ncbi:hypothetical protein PINS_up000828 [Pythium insidiosum]|nr:hypothetical protein PINS_up000828 [Pythium insidiosum]